MTTTLEPRRTLLGAGGYALENIVPEMLEDGATCMVLSEGAVYRLDRFSTIAVTPPRVIATLRGPNAPGRWISTKQVSPLAIGTELYLIDNRGKAKIYGYEPELASTDGYDGPPSSTLALPPAITGVGHGIAILPDDSKLVATSEYKPTNYYESFFYVPAGLSGELREHQVGYVNSGLLFGGADAGARTVGIFPDGTTMLSRGGSCFARPTLAELQGVPNIAKTPVWKNSSAAAVMGWDGFVEHGANRHLVWHLGYDSLYRHDLDAEPGPIAPDKIAKTTNIGTAGWGGMMARDLAGNTYVTRSETSDVVVFSEEQLDGLTAAPSVIAPVRTIRTALWDAIDTDQEFIWGIAITREGGMYVSTYMYGAAESQKARVFYLDPDAAGGDGLRPVARTFRAPAPTIEMIRCGLGYGAFLT